METPWTKVDILEGRANFEWKICVWIRHVSFLYLHEPFSEKSELSWLDQRSGPLKEIYESSTQWLLLKPGKWMSLLRQNRQRTWKKVKEEATVKGSEGGRIRKLDTHIYFTDVLSQRLLFQTELWVFIKLNYLANLREKKTTDNNGNEFHYFAFCI